MDDGGFTGNGLKLYTNAFSSSDLDLLIDALDKNFGIKATINKSSIKDQQTLYISKKQLPLVVDLVKDHMHPTLKGSMLYKLNTSAPPLANIFFYIRLLRASAKKNIRQQ